MDQRRFNTHSVSSLTNIAVRLPRTHSSLPWFSTLSRGSSSRTAAADTQRLVGLEASRHVREVFSQLPSCGKLPWMLVCSFQRVQPHNDEVQTRSSACFFNGVHVRWTRVWANGRSQGRCRTMDGGLEPTRALHGCSKYRGSHRPRTAQQLTMTIEDGHAHSRKSCCS